MRLAGKQGREHCWGRLFNDIPPPFAYSVYVYMVCD